MLANLLHCCPVVRDLRLKLNKGYFGKRCSIFKEVQADFNKSVDRFRDRRSPIMVSIWVERRTMVAIMRPRISLA
jgi:ribosomal protein L20